MALQIGDNFQYQGQKPNFVRDEFETLALMKAFPETSLNEGHLSFCKETSLVYKFLSTNTVDDSTGKWRIFEGVQSDMVRTIVVTESAPSKQDNILYFEYEPISMMLARSVEKKTISIIAEFLEIPIKNKEVLVNLTLANYTTDKIGRVRILLKNEYPNEVNLNIKEVNGNQINANNNYFFGDSKVGFNLESNNIMEIPYKLVFNESGYTELTFSLIQLDTGKVLASEKYGIQIKEN